MTNNNLVKCWCKILKIIYEKNLLILDRLGKIIKDDGIDDLRKKNICIQQII